MIGRAGAHANVSCPLSCRVKNNKFQFNRIWAFIAFSCTTREYNQHNVTTVAGAAGSEQWIKNEKANQEEEEEEKPRKHTHTGNEKRKMFQRMIGNL